MEVKTKSEVVQELRCPNPECNKKLAVSQTDEIFNSPDVMMIKYKDLFIYIDAVQGTRVRFICPGCGRQIVITGRSQQPKPEPEEAPPEPCPKQMEN